MLRVLILYLCLAVPDAFGQSLAASEDNYGGSMDGRVERVKRALIRAKTAMQRSKVSLLRIFAEHKSAADDSVAILIQQYRMKDTDPFSDLNDSKKSIDIEEASRLMHQCWMEIREIKRLSVVKSKQLNLQKPDGIGIPYVAEIEDKELVEPSHPEIKRFGRVKYLELGAFYIEQLAQKIEAISEQFVVSADLKKNWTP